MTQIELTPYLPPPAGAPLLESLTLRDWFAGQALAGILPRLMKDLKPGDEDVAAITAFNLADAMLAQRDMKSVAP